MATGRPAIGEIDRHAGALSQLIERVRHQVPYYTEHLARCDNDDFASVPTSSKSTFAPWGQRPLSACDGHRADRYCATSGTTGPRTLVGFSERDWDRLANLLAGRARAIGLTADDLMVNTHGYGLWIGGPALDLVARGAGAGLLPVGPGQTDRLITWLGDLPITAMSATPSFLRYLGERIAQHEIDTSAWQLGLGLIGGECASLELRREVGRRLGATFRWQELYGASEVGGPTLGWSPPHDPMAGRLLVDTEEFVVEVLRLDRDEPVAPGELGELTVSTPWRDVDPLVRYRTRDLTRSLPEIDDPSGFPSISTIVGRIDDALKVRGVLVHPSAIEAVVVEHCDAGSEWRIVVDREPGRLDTLTVVVEHHRADANGLADILHQQIAMQPVIEVVDPGSLERFEGKSARVLDRR